MKTIRESILGVDGKPSSKKLTILWFVILISWMVFFLQGMVLYILAENIQVTETQKSLIELATVSLVLYFLASVLALNGIAWGQQSSIMKILNPPPAEKNTIVQTGSPVVNVEEQKPEP